jgi:DNA invertase Pin-like site-specific DNA recombinase
MNDIQVFSYQRFSSVKQGDGDSIRRQTKRRDDWLARHSLVLDERLSYRDAGKSALRGRHAREGELADFLAVIDRGEVHKGDILIIEALDRLTRQKPLEAVGLVSRILASRIRIVTLDPEREYDWDSANNIGALMEMIVILCRGNEESERKSSLSRRNWDRLRAVARNGAPITPTGPHWLRLVEGKWKEIPGAVAVVKRIVRMALDGYGTETIARFLNREQVPTLRHGRAWCHSTIGIILRTPALIGGYQPKSKTSGKNTPVGDVIEGYYGKGIISKRDFYRLQEALDSRMPQGRTGATVRNIFKGLVRDLRGDTLTVVY